MDPAWIAVVGTAIGVAGATGAAAIAGWSARRQASAQNISQEHQWQREKRLDAYSAFLDAGVQLRDELAAVWRLLKSPTQDAIAIRARLESADPLVNTFRRASARNFVIGPERIREPTRRAEESVVLFHVVLRAAIKDLEERRSIRDRLLTCARQEAHVRDLLDRFSASAREELNGEEADSRLLKKLPPAPAENELAWLLKIVAGKLQISEKEIDIKRPLFETGLDSLGLLECSAEAIMEFDLSGEESWPISSLLFTEPIEKVACYIAELRKKGD